MTVTATKSGFSFDPVNITVASASTTTFDVALLADPGTVTGTVSSSAGGTITGAVVTIDGVQGTTNSSGVYTIANVPAGSNESLTASISNYSYGGANLTVPSDIITTFDFTMTGNPGNITGIVTSSVDGSGVSGVNVTIGGISATTNSGGVYTVTGIAAGNRSVTAAKTNYTYSGANVFVPVAGSANFSFVMQADPGTVSGSISPAGVNVTVTLSPGGYSTTSSTGTYSISNVPVGNYTLSTSAIHYQAYTSSSFPVASDLTSTQNITLTPNPGTVSGTITPGGVSVTITLSPGNYSTASSSGNYSISNIPPNNYTLTASATGYAPWTSGLFGVTSDNTSTQNVTLTQTPLQEQSWHPREETSDQVLL